MSLYKKITITICLFLFSCMSDSMSNENQSDEINNENIDWFYDVNSEQLFLQIDLSHIEPILIQQFSIKLSPLYTEFQEIFDNGEQDDLVAGNQIYSILIDNVGFSNNYVLSMQLNFTDDSSYEFDYNINFNAPTIINDSVYPNIPSEHILDEDNYTLFTIILAIEDEDGSEDIDYVRFHIKKVNFFDAELVDGVCEYELIQSNEYQWDPSWEMSYIGENINGQYVYKTDIPMNPIQSQSLCGGFGEVQFKFTVQDQKGFEHSLELENTIEICPGVCE